jgi:hypothetical protein
LIITSQRRWLRQCLANYIAAAKEELSLSISELVLMFLGFLVKFFGNVVGDGWSRSLIEELESLLRHPLYTLSYCILASFIVRICFFGPVHCGSGRAKLQEGSRVLVRRMLVWTL